VKSRSASRLADPSSSSAGRTSLVGTSITSPDRPLNSPRLTPYPDREPGCSGMTDLDLVPTQDLLKALKRCFDHMVFAGIKHMGAVQRLQPWRLSC